MPKTHFHKKGCALGLILKVRVFGTQKWSIPLLHAEKGHQRNRGVCTQAKTILHFIILQLRHTVQDFSLILQRFSYDLEMKTREQNRNNKRTEIE